MKELKHTFLLLLKLTLVVGTLGYLLISGRLQLSSLRVFVDDSFLLFFNAFVWFVGVFFCTSYRWFMLLKGMQVSIPFSKVLRLNSIGFFFNTVAPGAVGGDLVKAYYLFRQEPSGQRTPALLAIFLDRLLGLYCVFFIATATLLIFDSDFAKHKALAAMAGFSVLCFSGMSLLFLTLFLYRKPIEQSPLYRILNRPYFGFRSLQKMMLSLSMLREHPRYFFQALLAGIAYQIFYMTFFAVIAYRLGNNFQIPNLAAVLPLGFLASALPIAPGGLGLGHLAYDQLFSMVGIQEGANIFNFVFLGQSAFNLLGLIPYLTLRQDLRLSKAEALAEQNLV